MSVAAEANAMIVVGIDLAGPNNAAHTDFAAFRENGDRLEFLCHAPGASDTMIHSEVAKYGNDETIVVGLDAPLSYSQSGGDRPADADLRRRVISAGLPAGTVMAPTAPRMVYLTLRGVVVARGLSTIEPRPPRIVETHPSAALVLRDASPGDVRALKRDQGAREQLARWLRRQGVDSPVLRAAGHSETLTDHHIAACACALAARDWYRDQPRWIIRAAPPDHPFDFAC